MIKQVGQFFRSVFAEQVFVRSIYAETLLENFFVSATASLLVTRLLLSLTGYPTFGGERFHIAHMLLGGLLMLVALIILLAGLNHAAHELAAIISGAGFGIFIDELGKFITHDNNYFYQPTVALIYAVFVLIYLVIRRINRQRALTREEALANAFEIAKQASLSRLDTRDQQLIVRLLDLCDPNDPLTRNLKDMLPRISTVPSRHPHFITRIKGLIDSFYQAVAARRWFTSAVISFFVLSSGFTLYGIIALVDWSWVLIIWVTFGIIILLILTGKQRGSAAYLQVIVSVSVIAVAMLIAGVVLANLKTTPASFSNFAQFIFSGISAVLIVIGTMRMRRFRLGAYQMFRRAILVSILLTRVFSFYDDQFFALSGLAWDILVLLALRYMIRQEETRLGRVNGTKT